VSGRRELNEYAIFLPQGNPTGRFAVTLITGPAFDFTGNVALVTGASRGIGAAVAKMLGAGGAKVYINYLTHADEADAVVSAVKSAGGSAEAARFDASSPEEVSSAVADVLKREEGIDLLVNNAGVRFDSLTHSTTDEQWRDCLRINLNSAFCVTREIIKPMARRKKGSIVVVSSIAGSIGSFGQSAYAAAKAGLVGFAKSVALEYGGKGVRINAVIPGIINTEMTKNLREDFRRSVLAQIPCNRFGEPEEVAAPVCFLLSDAASYINGATLHINGGGLRL
jgi:3-oxoacyl-[acyl-carrier protein] reductase